MMLSQSSTEVVLAAAQQPVGPELRRVAKDMVEEAVMATLVAYVRREHLQPIEALRVTWHPPEPPEVPFVPSFDWTQDIWMVRARVRAVCS